MANDIITQLSEVLSDLDASDDDSTAASSTLEISKIYGTLCGDFTLFNQQQDSHELFLYLHEQLITWLKRISSRYSLAPDFSPQLPPPRLDPSVHVPPSRRGFMPTKTANGSPFNSMIS